MPQRYIWSKLARPQWEEEWRETLRFAGETRLVVASLPGRRSIRLELYDLSQKEAEHLLEECGGSIRRQPSPQQWLKQQPPRKPLKIRGRLRIIPEAADIRLGGGSGVRELIIPAGLAFGTGEHSTTATCLRMLCDLEDTVLPQSWSLLDAGTGSGILAIAASVLGAARVEAFDFDPMAVRTARENAVRNGAAGIRIVRRDLHRWQPGPRRKWDVVTANLFSELLVKGMPKLAQVLKKPGYLILSGILRHQEEEVDRAVRAQDLEPVQQVRRGKWVTLRYHRPR